MSPAVEQNLTLILFLPWFAILIVLYWLYPRAPRGVARITYDLVALLLAISGFVASVHWSYAVADPFYGRLWKQILPTAVSYGVFLGVLAPAYLLRGRLLARRRAEPHPPRSPEALR